MKEGIPDIPDGTGNMSGFWEKWLCTGKCGLDGVVGGCSTLHQQGCILTGPHDHFLVVFAFPEEFSHYSPNSFMADFRNV